jgi:hypothetical protein
LSLRVFSVSVSDFCKQQISFDSKLLGGESNSCVANSRTAVPFQFPTKSPPETLTLTADQQSFPVTLPPNSLENLFAFLRIEVASSLSLFLPFIHFSSLALSPTFCLTSFRSSFKSEQKQKQKRARNKKIFMFIDSVKQLYNVIPKSIN